MAKKKKKSKSPSQIKSFPKKERRKLARQKRRETRAIQRAKKAPFDFIDDIELQEYEDEVVRNLFKQQANIKRQITRKENKAAKEYAEAWKPEEEKRAEELNEALDIASELQKNFKHGNGKYAQYLEPLMQRLKELGYDYDEQLDEGKNFLYKNVRFDKLPDDDRVKQLVDKILSLNYSSYENYQNMLTENAAMAYASNIGSLTPEQAQNFAALADIMNTSAAWAIAKKNAPDSEQTKANWVQLYSIADLAYKNGKIEEFTREIINNPDYNTVDTAEKFITEALKGD